MNDTIKEFFKATFFGVLAGAIVTLTIGYFWNMAHGYGVRWKDKARAEKGSWIEKKGFSDDMNDIVNYAYYLGGKDFVYTMDCENGTWNSGRRSMIKGANGYYDRGQCQLNYQRHADFINSEAFLNPYKQVGYCHGVWSDAWRKNRIWTTFYAYRIRRKCEDNFIIHINPNFIGNTNGYR